MVSHCDALDRILDISPLSQDTDGKGKARMGWDGRYLAVWK